MVDALPEPFEFPRCEETAREPCISCEVRLRHIDSARGSNTTFRWRRDLLDISKPTLAVQAGDEVYHINDCEFNADIIQFHFSIFFPEQTSYSAIPLVTSLRLEK
jgi:hypothetical protein